MKEPVEKVRIDKWLWAARLYKTRSSAAEACVKGRIKIAGVEAKASRNVKIGEEIDIHRGPWYQKIRVLTLLDRRVSAALVKEFMEDITLPEETERMKLHLAAKASWNIKGSQGRPTKKDRRDMEEFLGDFFD